MKKMKILSLILVILLIAMNVAACSSKNNANTPSQQQQQQNNNASGPEYTLQIAGAYALNADTPRAKATKMMKDLIEQKSNGKIKVELYLDSQLGGDRETLESCQAGNIAMVSLTTAPAVNFVPKLAIFDIPMLFDNLDVAKKVLSGEFRQKLAQEYEKAGFKLLLMVPISYREMTANKAINNINDFKGIKIRTMENKYHMEFWKALGANPTPLNFNELYIALQQGTVDAQENPYDVIMASKFYEVQKYINHTHHIAFIHTVVMNKNLYDSMPDDYKKIIDDSMNEVSEYLFNQAKVQNDQMLSVLKEKGMQVIELSQDVKDKMKEAANKVADMVRKDVGNEIVDELLKAIEDAKKQ
ncbi:MAG: TRAP transporter substrate-binding protein [Thermovenabulum sp.]|uniref:TRAP transporter substrate-binding protein n=1 Tax=Thermovenabulum sp. TaxID=3100335 RepID=UPI003C7A4B49